MKEKLVTLKRTSDDGVQTLGLFMFEVDNGIMTLGSLELPWKENAPLISCIPKGKYHVKTTYSSKYKRDMWEIMDVTNRSGVRIHSANFYFEIEGCIVLGLSQDDINKDGKMDMVSSRKAIKLAQKYLGKEFTLEII